MSVALSLDFELRHDVLGGHDVYWLKLGDSECGLVVDYARDDYRRASLISRTESDARGFVVQLAKGLEQSLDIDINRLERRTSPGDAKFVYVMEHQDEDGVDWRVCKMGFGSDPSIYLHISTSSGRARLEERSSDARRNFVESFARALLKSSDTKTSPFAAVDSNRPDWWVSNVPLVSWFRPTEIVFQGAPSFFEETLVGVSQNAVVAAHREGKLVIHEPESTGEIKGIVAHHSGLFIVQDELDGSRVMRLKSLDSEIEELIYLDEELGQMPILSPDGEWMAQVLNRRSGAETVLVHLAGTREEILLDRLWATSWGPNGLELKDVEDGRWFVWKNQEIIALDGPPPRRIGPFDFKVGDVLSVANHDFSPPNASSRRRMVTNVYEWVDGPFVVADWSDTFLLNMETGRGWTLLPEAIASRGSVQVSTSLSQMAFTTGGGKCFLAEISPRFLNEDLETETRSEIVARLKDSLAGDLYEFRGVTSHLSLAQMSREFGLEVSELRHRLSEGGKEFVDAQLREAGRLLSERRLTELAALSIHHAAAWSLLAEGLSEHELLAALGDAAANTFVDRLVREEVLHQVLFGGTRPSSQAWEGIVEVLHAAESVWLSGDLSGLEAQLQQALQIVFELIEELKLVALLPSLWNELELRVDRIQHLIDAEAGAPNGLEELLEVVRCVEEMTASL